jgi:hypothetical protein
MVTVLVSTHHGYGVVPGDHGLLGLLVWVEDAVAFFPVVGRAAVVQTVIAGVAGSRDARATVEYLLERGGGALRSFSEPTELEALSLADAARRFASLHHLELDVRGPEPARCSACGTVREALQLVNVLYSRGERAGRLLVFCPGCLDERRSHLGEVELPLSELTIDGFVGLYRDGYTSSNPAMAAAIAFGEAPIAAVRGATRALADRVPASGG